MKLLRIRFDDGTFHTANLHSSGIRVGRTPHAALAYVWDTDTEGQAKAKKVAWQVGGVVEEYEYEPMCKPMRRGRHAPGGAR